jgi:hypothetical protein
MPKSKRAGREEKRRLPFDPAQDLREAGAAKGISTPETAVVKQSGV